MPLPQFLTRTRPMYRTAAVALGVGFAGLGLAIGVSEHFAHWPVVAFSVVAGALLLCGGIFLEERRLQFFFAVLLIANAVMALYALVSSLSRAT